MWVKVNRNNNYSVNEKGEVRNDSTGKIKTPTVNKRNGYLVLDLYDKNKREKVPVHRIIAEAFIPNPQNKPTVDHIDGNRANNSIENLRWATYSEQNSRFKTIGLRSEKITVLRFAEKRRKRGGGHEEWLNVIEELRFDKIKDAADYFGCTIGNISLMLKNGTIGVRGKTRGYKFLYVDSRKTYS